MKQTVIYILLFLALVIRPFASAAQTDELAQLALNYQKLAELKKALQNMYRGYRDISRRFDAVREISQGSFNLHNSFLSAQLSASPAVRSYSRINEIIRIQSTIAHQYRDAFILLQRDINFQPAEIDYFKKTFGNVFRLSIRNLDVLTQVLYAPLRMSDDDRLKAIDNIYTDMYRQHSFLKHFIAQASLLARQRAGNRVELKTIRSLYGYKNKNHE